MFRFASVSIANLTRGIEGGFADIASPENVSIIRYAHAPAHDYMGYERNYGMLYHTQRHPEHVEAETLRGQEIKRLKLLARKFMEDVVLGEHLFVVKRKQPLLAEEVSCLITALRRKGSAWLLWVREADGQHPPGTAELVTTGLIAGYIDRIDVSPLKNISVDCWAAVCCAAFSHWRNRTATEITPVPRPEPSQQLSGQVS